ncbi:MAG TPA: hypothetical protein DCZ63_12995 [Geobacter sp.]|nr:hypothetical protein [Geobacter sp.]
MILKIVRCDGCEIHSPRLDENGIALRNILREDFRWHSLSKRDFCPACWNIRKPKSRRGTALKSPYPAVAALPAAGKDGDVK